MKLVLGGIFLISSLYNTACFCAEAPKPIRMGFFPYDLPKGTLPVISTAIRDTTDTAAREMQDQGYSISKSDIESGAAVAASRLTTQRNAGLYTMEMGALMTFLGISDPHLFPRWKMIGPCICIAGTCVFCDAMCNCCCRKEKVIPVARAIKAAYDARVGRGKDD